MMRHSPVDRLNLRDSLTEVRQMNDGLTVLIPTVVEKTTFDRDTDADRDVSLGDGTGRTFTWTAQVVQAMVREVNVHLVTFGSVPPGAEIGDLLVAIGVRDVATFSNARLTDLAYVWARGERYHIWGINGLGVARVEEYIVWLRRAGQTIARHADY